MQRDENGNPGETLSCDAWVEVGVDAHASHPTSRGAQGKRSALPNTRILIHQAPAGFQGTASDIEFTSRPAPASRAGCLFPRWMTSLPNNAARSAGRPGACSGCTAFRHSCVDTATRSISIIIAICYTRLDWSSQFRFVV